MQIERPVREHHSLRSASASARIKQLCDVVLVEREEFRSRQAVTREQFVQRQVRWRDLLVDADIAFDRGAGFSQVLDERSEFTLEKQHAGVGMVEDFNQLDRLEPHIEGHYYGANQRWAIVALQKLIVIKAEISDPVTGTNAFRKQASREAFTAFTKLG